MKKILFFVESLTGGGAEKVLSDLVANIDKTKYSVTVFSLVDIGVYQKMIQQHCEYKYFVPNLGEGKNFLAILSSKIKYKLTRILPPKVLYRWIIKSDFDTEVAFTEGFSTRLIAASGNSSSKKIAWVHIDLFENHWSKIEYKSIDEEIKSYENFDKIVCVAESVKKAFSKRFGISQNVIVKYNPVDRDDIIKKANQPIDNLNLNLNTNNIKLVTIGRLEDQKGYDRLLKVMHRLKVDGLDFNLWIIGQGSKKNELEVYIKDNGLTENVHLLGFQSNPYNYLQASDAFVCSSRSEGFSTVVTEALILGKPVVTTNCSGMQELLGNNEFGIITENNTESLYNGLKEYMTNPSLQEKYKNASRVRGAKFEIGPIVDEIHKIL